MLATGTATFLLLAIWVATFLLGIRGTDGIIFSYWLKKFREQAGESEVHESRKAKLTRTLGELTWEVTRAIGFGLAVLFIVDGLIFRLGLLYSPRLSFFNPVDSHIQVAGFILSSVGIVVNAVAARTLAEHVYCKAKEERKMMTTGIYAYVRHPYYLSFILIPAGQVLVTLNYLSLLLLLPWLFFTDGEIEEWIGKRKLTFFTTAIEYEEQALLKMFGKDYEEYMKRTGRFFPRIRF